MTNVKRGGNFYGRFNQNLERAAAIERGDKFYTSSVPCPNGHTKFRVAGYRCHECRLEWQRQSWAKRFPDQEARDLRASKMPKEQKLKAAKRTAIWAKNNRERYRAIQREREAAQRTRTPLWADRGEIRRFYENCPKGWHVDHIIPLRGRVVSGLHVIQNLQYLTAEENVKKNRKFEVYSG